MSYLPSSTEEAFRDTLILRATGTALEALGELYGLPKPGYASDANWQQALKAAALGPRGTFGTLLGFLEGAAGFLETEIAVTVDPAFPQRLTSPTSAWDQLHVGRWVRLDLDGQLYRIDGPQTVTGASVELTPVATPYWAAADFSGLAGVTSTTARLLGFVARERSPGPEYDAAGMFQAAGPGLVATVEITLYATSLINASYLVADGVARPAGQPFGGQLLANELQDGDNVQQFAGSPAPGTGPFPLYLAGSSALPEIEEQLRELTAAGVRVIFASVGF